MSHSHRNPGPANWLRSFILLLPALALAQPTLESARRLRQQGDLPAALQAYQAILPAHPGEPQVFLELAQVAMALADYPRAIDASTQAANLFHQRGDSGNEALAANLAGSSYLYRGEYANALRNFQHALDIDRASPRRQGRNRPPRQYRQRPFLPGQVPRCAGVLSARHPPRRRDRRRILESREPPTRLRQPRHSLSAARPIPEGARLLPTRPKHRGSPAPRRVQPPHRQYRRHLPAPRRSRQSPAQLPGRPALLRPRHPSRRPNPQPAEHRHGLRARPARSAPRPRRLLRGPQTRRRVRRSPRDRARTPFPRRSPLPHGPPPRSRPRLRRRAGRRARDRRRRGTVDRAVRPRPHLPPQSRECPRPRNSAPGHRRHRSRAPRARQRRPQSRVPARQARCLRCRDRDPPGDRRRPARRALRPDRARARRAGRAEFPLVPSGLRRSSGPPGPALASGRILARAHPRCRPVGYQRQERRRDPRTHTCRSRGHPAVRHRPARRAGFQQIRMARPGRAYRQPAARRNPRSPPRSPTS